MTPAPAPARRVPTVRGPSPDAGSTIPLILGFFLLAAIVVAGGIAASDAFVDQRDVQSTCDGAAIAAANAVDLGAVRGSGGAAALDTGRLPLGSVQQAAEAYLDRDAGRSGTGVSTSLSDDATRVRLVCTQTRPVTFGALFGFGGGVQHVVESTAVTPTG